MLTEKIGMEVRMAESRREGSQAVKEVERSMNGNRGEAAAERNRDRGSQTVQQQAERIGGFAQEGVRHATDASKAAASGVVRSSSAFAESAQEITTAWAHYAEEVMRHTSEASRALLRARTFSEMLEVQAKLLRDNMQAFLDQSAKIAEAASRMATRPLEALKEAGSEQIRR
jgi:hypothetical protein